MLKNLVFRTLDVFKIPFLFEQLRVCNEEVSILTFHRVTDDHDLLWPPMTVTNFRLLIEYLISHTVIVPLQDLWEIEIYPSKPLVCLSFDDGYMDFYENVLPILKYYGVPCHHNICPGLIDDVDVPWPQVVNGYLQQNLGGNFVMPDKTLVNIPKKISENYYLTVLDMLYRLGHKEREVFVSSLKELLSGDFHSQLMGWQEIRACHAAGVHIGSHSLSHNHLPTVADDDLLSNEVVDSRLRIFEEVGEYPEIFAFPSGFFDDRTLSLVRECGYRIALLCEDKPFHYRQTQSDRFSVFTRINIANGSFFEEKARALGFHSKTKGFLGRVT